MKKYIKLDDVITTLHKYFSLSFAMQDAEDDLTSIPAADVEEVKHGKWIDKGHYTVMCVNCGVYIARGGLLINQDKIYYCPRCGAKMDGKGE